MSVEIFQSHEWFAHLWKSGFEKQPQRCWWWVVQTPGKGQDMRIPLVQDLSGSGLASLSNYYTVLFGPEASSSVVLPPNPQHWQQAVDALRSIPGSHVLRLQPLDAESQWLAALEKNLRQRGFWTRRVFSFGNWYQTVGAEGFDRYWSERPSALANTVRRGKRRLSAAGEWRIDIHRDSGASKNLEKAIQAYEEVYKNSWKQPEPCAQFMPGLMRLAAEKGWLRVGVLWLNDVPLASQFWLTTREKANIYKLAYAKGCEKFSAGSILTAAMMEHAMDIDQVAEVDYLSGDDGYKADWMGSRRERHGLVAIDLRKRKGWVAAITGVSRMGLNFAKRKLSRT